MQFLQLQGELVPDGLQRIIMQRQSQWWMLYLHHLEHDVRRVADLLAGFYRRSQDDYELLLVNRTRLLYHVLLLCMRQYSSERRTRTGNTLPIRYTAFSLTLKP